MSAVLPPGWHIALTGGDEVVVRGPEDGPGSMTLPSDVEQGSLPVRLLNALCRAMLAATPAPQTIEVENAHAQFNAAINFAIEQGVEAATFLTAWREGDTSEWPEFRAKA